MKRWLPWLTSLAVALVHQHASACAVAPPEGAFVSVAEESAVIVWDAASKTEHFIRNAAFRSSPPPSAAQRQDFGFLVPTPDKPTLEDADDSVFAQLEEVVRPEVIYKSRPELEPTLSCLFFLARGAKTETAGVPPVRVLEQRRVGAFDAAVLEADDAGALGEWLTAHGYAKRPALAEWLAPYVAQKWKISAFKIADDVASEGPLSAIAARAVHMTFKTERPFFPYREPRDQRESVPPSLSGKRSLRVFFLGDGKVSPKIGDGSTRFAGSVTWAGPFEPVRSRVTLPSSITLPAAAWLTTIEDDAALRPGVDELWLDRASDAQAVKPPPLTIPVASRITIPIDLLALVGVIGFLVVRRVRRAAT